MSRAPRRWLALGAAVLVAAVVVIVLLINSSGGGPRRRATLPRARAPAPPAGEQFGVNVNRLFNGRSYSQAQIDAQLRALAATGATLARSDALWELSEPTPPTGGVHHYDWGFDDEIAAALASHGLRWLPILDYSPLWARVAPTLLHSAPASTAAFAAFAAALAARYGPDGAFWRAHPELAPLPIQTLELWNEPDNGQFWEPQPDPAAYADLYIATRSAVARVDTAARVIVGGLTRPATFLPELVLARPQLASALAGVAIHPYGATPAVVLAKVRQARRTLTALRLPNVPLFVTEFGWTIHPAGALNYAPAALRPGYIERTLAALGHTDCGVAAVLLYTWVTPQSNPADKEDWFGINPPSGGPTPDGLAFASGLRLAAAKLPRVAICGST